MFISSEIGSQWVTILGHPQMIECMVICVLSQVHGSDLRSPDVYLHIMKKLSGNFSLNSARVRALGWLLLRIFSGVLSFLSGGYVGQIIYKEYTAQIFPGVWPVV